MEPKSVLATQLAILTQIVAVGGVLNACKLMLFMNNIIPTRSTLFADLVEAVFDGYAQFSPVVFGTSYIDPQGAVRIDGVSHDFICTGITTTPTIYGWALLDTTGAILVAAAQLPAPVPITAIHQGIRVVPTFAYGD